MEIVYQRCAGLDVHKRTVVACANTLDADGEPTKQRCTFGTMTTDLIALRDWLKKHRGVTHVRHGKYWSLLEAYL